MNSIVEQACNSVNGHSAPDAFNLIEQQAERIKELEAELNAQVAAATEYVNALSFTRRDLAALRQRIADAPVVSWRCECNGGETYHFGFQEPTPSDWKSCIPLISKEDLQK